MNPCASLERLRTLASGSQKAAFAGHPDARAAALLHMLSGFWKTLPVLVVDSGDSGDSGDLSPGDLRGLARSLGMSDVRVVEPDRHELFLQDPDGILHICNPSLSHRLRRIDPLLAALEEYDLWISPNRESAGLPDSPSIACPGGPLKVSPLESWSDRDIAAYIERNQLPGLPGRNQPARAIAGKPRAPIKIPRPAPPRAARQIAAAAFPRPPETETRHASHCH